MGGLAPAHEGEEIPVRIRLSATTLAALGAAVLVVLACSASAASQQTYAIKTRAGKVASLYGTAGLQIRFSALLEEEAEAEDAVSGAPITQSFVTASSHVRRMVPGSPAWKPQATFTEVSNGTSSSSGPPDHAP